MCFKSVISFCNIGDLEERPTDSHSAECRGCRCGRCGNCLVGIFVWRALKQIFYQTLLTTPGACHKLCMFYSFLSSLSFPWDILHIRVCFFFLKTIDKAFSILEDPKWCWESWTFCKSTSFQAFVHQSQDLQFNFSHLLNNSEKFFKRLSNHCRGTHLWS